MKTIALLFTWVPLILVFNPRTSADVDYIFGTMLLLWLAVEFCTDAYREACSISFDAIRAEHEQRYERAMAVNDFDAAMESIMAHRLFITRGG
ncbi:hypothetical protein OTERR_12890 [Oryzomicrobium terrae]|uniref:Uncharacterized protein n=1 Tax=Oryzomicrobium terrae TaxID=1735038 RepID=A0A5C1E820_9RHOO|nr:hypothetical protein [Oryzomicrobium terrae]QEL64765.1 hypothetical protein OTERR_12890 [Oryzomicrobium terrae]